MNKVKCLILLILVVILLQCSGVRKMVPVKNEDSAALKFKLESEFKLLKEKGDQEFSKMYYLGWYQAANSYEKALELKKSTEIKEKLFFSYFLMALRESLYFIDNTESRRKALHLASELNQMIPEKNPFAVIAEYLLKEKTPSASDISETSLSQLKNAADADYKYFLYTKYVGLKLELFANLNDAENFVKEAENFAKLFPSSNLKYFVVGDLSDIQIALEKYPDFFELYLVSADDFFQKQNFEKSSQHYLKALELYPDLPPALYGMGKIYYDIGVKQTALEYFEKVVQTHPDYLDTLFLKGVCLHDLERYDESNEVMNIVGKPNTIEKGHACYYIALNYFNLKNYPEVEKNIKIAESIIYHSFPINILAGLFYFQTEHYKESRLYFGKAQEISKNHPDCYYYPGLMDLKEKKVKSAFKKFYLAAVYYKSELDRQFERIKAIDENQKSELLLRKRWLLEKNLNKDAEATIQKLDAVLNAFPKSQNKEIKEIRKTVQYIRERYLKTF